MCICFLLIIIITISDFIIIGIVILFYFAAIFLGDFPPFYYIVRFLKSEIVSSTVQTALRHLPLEYSHFDQIFTRGIQYVPPTCAVNERERGWVKGRKSIWSTLRGTQTMRIFQVDFIIYFCFVLSICICISYFVFAVWQISTAIHTYIPFKTVLG